MLPYVSSLCGHSGSYTALNASPKDLLAAAVTGKGGWRASALRSRHMQDARLDEGARQHTLELLFQVGRLLGQAIGVRLLRGQGDVAHGEGADEPGAGVVARYRSENGGHGVNMLTLCLLKLATCSWYSSSSTCSALPS